MLVILSTSGRPMVGHLAEYSLVICQHSTLLFTQVTEPLKPISDLLKRWGWGVNGKKPQHLQPNFLVFERHPASLLHIYTYTLAPAPPSSPSASIPPQARSWHCRPNPPTTTPIRTLPHLSLSSLQWRRLPLTQTEPYLNTTSVSGQAVTGTAISTKAEPGQSTTTN